MNNTKQSPSTNGGEGNRQSLLKLTFAAGVMAVSCGKSARGGNNNNANNSANNSGNNNDGGGSGGNDGNGGGGTPAAPAIAIENVDANVVEVKDGTNIELKVSGFPTAAINANIANTTLVSLATAPTNSLKRAFDIVIKGTGGTAATAGLVLVDIGSRTNVGAFSIDAINKALNTYTGTDLKEGLRNSAPIATDAANAEAAKAGWNIYGGFMSDTVPTTGATDAAPFAFTATSATHPVLFCRTTVTTVTDGGAAGTGTLQDATVLTGGQKASCYVGAVGVAFTDTAADIWLKKTAGNTFKKKFGFTAAGIKTDAKTIGTMGLPGTDKAAAFRDGLSGAEMTDLAAANPSAFKKFSVSIVRDADFTYIAPEITFQNFDAGAKLVTGTGGALDTIKIKASTFPVVNVGINQAGGYTSVYGATTGTLKRVFDIAITGGGTGTVTGGLILVGGGNVASVNDFSDQTSGTADDAVGHAEQEGYSSSTPNSMARADGAFPAGWNHIGAFMNSTGPRNIAEADANASPFAFTEIPTGSTQPFMFCRATLSQITDQLPSDPSGIKSTSTLAGGETASCYVGSKGFDAFTTTRKTEWLNTAASATFKKTFNIAIGGIRTDGKTVSQFMPGADDTARVNALNNGLSSAEISDITMNYPSAYKKVSVTIVSDANF